MRYGGILEIGVLRVQDV